MGLFWISESESDLIIEQVENTAGEINRYLSQLQTSLIANDGATNQNIQELRKIHDNLYDLQLKMTNLLSKLSASKQSGVRLPWIDGRYYPLFMWQLSYNAAVAKLEYAIHNYSANI